MFHVKQVHYKIFSDILFIFIYISFFDFPCKISLPDIKHKKFI